MKDSSWNESEPPLTRSEFRHGSGVCGISTPESGPTLEFVTDPASHGEHGVVTVTLVPGHPGSLMAELLSGGKERAQCSSLGSIRFWGRFRDGTRVRLASAGPVHLVARTPSGTLLAGPATVQPERPWATLQW